MVSLIGKERVRVPQRHFRAIRDYTGGAVTLEELLPPVGDDSHSDFGDLGE
jgi:hypothetical protein